MVYAKSVSSTNQCLKRRENETKLKPQGTMRKLHESSLFLFCKLQVYKSVENGTIFSGIKV